MRLREDNDTLVLRTDFEQRDELIAADPSTYFITDHYLNYEWVLVRLSQIHLGVLRDLIRMAYRLAVLSKPKPRRFKRRRTPSRSLANR